MKTKKKRRLRSYLNPGGCLSVNVIQIFTQPVNSLKTRLFIYFELHYRRKRIKIPASVFLTRLHTHLIHSVNTECFEAQYNTNSLGVISLT
jgi:hypothetical protein